MGICCPLLFFFFFCVVDEFGCFEEGERLILSETVVCVVLMLWVWVDLHFGSSRNKMMTVQMNLFWNEVVWKRKYLFDYTASWKGTLPWMTAGDPLTI